MVVLPKRIVVAARARGFEHARDGEAGRRGDGEERPRLRACEALGISEEPIAVGFFEVPTEAVDDVGRLVGQERREERAARATDAVADRPKVARGGGQRAWIRRH